MEMQPQFPAEPPSAQLATDSSSSSIPARSKNEAAGDDLNRSNPELSQAPDHDVTWDSPDDPENPMNWSWGQKWGIVSLISAVTFNASLATTIFAPGVPALMQEFGSDNDLLASFAVSIFVIAIVFGPLLVAPLSELYGRAWVLNITNVLFLVFTVACAVSTDLGMFMAFRFIQGLWGCVPLTIGGGVIADIMEPAKRARALSGWQLGPLLGPVIGPVAGGYIAEYKGWRWSFWVVSIIAAVLAIGSFALMRETHPPTLLGRKAARLRKETGDPSYRSVLSEGGDSSSPRSPKALFARALMRPLRMLLSPIVALLALVVSVVYGYLYLLFTTFTTVFEGQYGFGPGAAGLAYLGMGVGFMAGLALVGGASDRLAVRLAAGGELKPEYRLPPLVLGALVIPVGLFWYGWTAEYRLHWMLPIAGSSFIGFGVLCIYTPVQAYLIDAFTVYAASASATNTVVRSLFGALLPLAGPPMYAKLGLGWGNSLLGFIAVAFIAVPFLLIKYGEQIRTSPKFRVDW